MSDILYPQFLKPLIDKLIAIVMFIILSPFFFIVGISLLVFNNGKVFFTQERPGKNAKIFKVIKFKTMNDKKDIHGNLLPDAERLNTLGLFIRKTSLDEIPQLINVIKGDMSLVGPRPLLVEYLPLYSNTQKKRHNVYPGITGLAQVNGRNAISWNEKFEYDVWYADHISFLLDLKIIYLTISKIFKSEGVNQKGHVTMEKFRGDSV